MTPIVVVWAANCESAPQSVQPAGRLDEEGTTPNGARDYMDPSGPRLCIHNYLCGAAAQFPTGTFGAATRHASVTAADEGLAYLRVRRPLLSGGASMIAASFLAICTEQL